MARREYLIGGEGNTPPPSSAPPKPLYRLLSAGTILGPSGNQVRDRLAVPSYGDGLSMLDRPKEFGQARFGFSSLNLTHVWRRPVILTTPFYHLLSDWIISEARGERCFASRQICVYCSDRKDLLAMYRRWCCVATRVASLAIAGGYRRRWYNSHPQLEDDSAYCQLRSPLSKDRPDPSGLLMNASPSGRLPALPSVSVTTHQSPSVPTRHTTGIERPWWVDRLPSHISKIEVSTECVGGPEDT